MRLGSPIRRAVVCLSIAAFVALAAPGAASAGSGGDRYYFRGKLKPSVSLTASAPGEVRVEVVRVGMGPVMSYTVEVGSSGSGGSGGVAAGTAGTASASGTATWYGRRFDGTVARDDDYRFRIADEGGTGAQLSGGQLGPFDFRRHIFPVRGPHDYGGAGSRFGAPRSGHTHQGQDVAAACGTKLVAAQGGTVLYRAYQAGGAGYYLVIRGKGSGKDYVYMHLLQPAAVAKGEKINTGQKIGYVGSTGSSTGCHLHFERWTKPGWFAGGHPYDPLPSLRYWDGYS
jgi:murein DD-endopeptidase MepM/ murein hydrolase activator NlpD